MVREGLAVKTIAVILAAGESRRMGVPKALLEAEPGVSFLRRLVELFEALGISSRVIVGAHAEEIRSANPRLALTVNEAWRDGQLSSARLGLSVALAERADQLLVQPIDAPLISSSTVEAVRAALKGSPAAIPTWNGSPGHPVGLSSSAAQQICRGPAKTLAEALGVLTAELVGVDDPAILDNFNSPEAYQLRFGRPPRAAR
jgi:molybdenum cofactor cytidylyltransferase